MLRLANGNISASVVSKICTGTIKRLFRVDNFKMHVVVNSGVLRGWGAKGLDPP